MGAAVPAHTRHRTSVQFCFRPGTADTACSPSSFSGPLRVLTTVSAGMVLLKALASRPSVDPHLLEHPQGIPAHHLGNGLVWVLLFHQPADDVGKICWIL